MNAEELAQRQLDAYNRRDLDAFLACYTEDVEMMDLGASRLLARGRTEMRAIYSKFFESAPELSCVVTKRICVGRFAVDEEVVTGVPGKARVHAAALYEATEDGIRRVWFLRS